MARRGYGIAKGEKPLRWSEMNQPKKQLLHVREQYGKEVIFKDLKTIRFRRTNSIDGQTVEFLSIWKYKQ